MNVIIFAGSPRSVWREGPPAVKPYPTAAEMIRKVAWWHGVTVEEIKGPCRKVRLVEARFDTVAAIFVNCRRQGPPSYSFIGRQMGDRDHTTIRNALRKRGLLVDRPKAEVEYIENRRQTIAILTLPDGSKVSGTSSAHRRERRRQYAYAAARVIARAVARRRQLSSPSSSA
jgi:hypothetical protein